MAMVVSQPPGLPGLFPMSRRAKQPLILSIWGRQRLPNREAGATQLHEEGCWVRLRKGRRGARLYEWRYWATLHEWKLWVRLHKGRRWARLHKGGTMQRYTEAIFLNCHSSQTSLVSPFYNLLPSFSQARQVCKTLLQSTVFPSTSITTLPSLLYSLRSNFFLRFKSTRVGTP